MKATAGARGKPGDPCNGQNIIGPAEVPCNSPLASVTLRIPGIAYGYVQTPGPGCKSTFAHVAKYKVCLSARKANIDVRSPGPQAAPAPLGMLREASMTGFSFAEATSMTFLKASISSSKVPPKPVLARLRELER